jgi:putative endonuclease
MAEHNELGEKGEAIAINHLRKNGYLILEQGWTWQHLELDIVACKGALLVIVEVKTRSMSQYASPDDTISNKKLRKIYDATEKYMDVKNIPWEVRYDLITIIYHGETWTVDHIVEAYYPFMNL